MPAGAGDAAVVVGLSVKFVNGHGADISLLREALYEIQETLCHRFLAVSVIRAARPMPVCHHATGLASPEWNLALLGPGWRCRARFVVENLRLRKGLCHTISFSNGWQFRHSQQNTEK